jgi:hypothetical protein
MFQRLIEECESLRNFEELYFKEAGFKERYPDVWRMVVAQWQAELVFRLNIPVSAPGAPFADKQEAYGWVMRTGFAVSVARMPATIINWQLTYRGIEIDCRPSAMDPWLVVENFQTGASLNRFQISHPSGAKFEFIETKYRSFLTGEYCVAKVSICAIDAKGTIQLRRSDAEWHVTYTTFEMLVSDRNEIFQTKITSGEDALSIEFALGYHPATYEKTRISVQSTLRHFWPQVDVIFHKNVALQRDYRLGVFTQLFKKAVDQVITDLQKPARTQASKPYGVRYQILPIDEIYDDLIVVNQAEFNISHRSRMMIQLPQNLTIQVSATPKYCQIMPSRPISVSIAGQMIRCPRQRYTVVWTSPSG